MKRCYAERLSEVHILLLFARVSRSHLVNATWNVQRIYVQHPHVTETTKSLCAHLTISSQRQPGIYKPRRRIPPNALTGATRVHLPRRGFLMINWPKSISSTIHSSPSNILGVIFFLSLLCHFGIIEPILSKAYFISFVFLMNSF